MRRLRHRVVAGMARPCREAPETQSAQQRTDAALRQVHAEPCLDHACKVDPPPAYHAVLRDRRPVRNEAGNRRILLGAQSRLGPWRRPIRQTSKPRFVVAVHPVAQRLAVHAALLRRLGARAALQHQCQGQHPPRRVAVRRARRHPPKSRRVQIPTRDRNSHRHRPPPPLNTARTESRPPVVRESPTSHPQMPLVLAQAKFRLSRTTRSHSAAW